MSGATVDAAILYLNHHEGLCCDCCEGYCPMVDCDGFDWWEHLVAFGQEHTGSSRLMMRTDALRNLPAAPDGGRPVVVQRGWAKIPHEKPPLSSREQTPRLLDRIDRAGLTLHDDNIENVVHVYLGDRHVGWCMWASNGGVTVDALPVIRAVSTAAGISIDQAAAAVEAMKTATS